MLYTLDMLEGMRCMLFCMLEAVEGGFSLLGVSEVPEVPEVMRCVLLCMLEAVEGELRLLEVLERCAMCWSSVLEL